MKFLDHFMNVEGSFQAKRQVFQINLSSKSLYNQKPYLLPRIVIIELRGLISSSVASSSSNNYSIRKVVTSSRDAGNSTASETIYQVQN